MPRREDYYSREELEVLLSMMRSGATVPEAAKVLGRKPYGLYTRVRRWRLAGVLPKVVHREDKTICPKCEMAPRAPRGNGSGLRAYCRPCDTENQADYVASDAGREARERWAAARRVKRAAEKAEKAARRVDGDV